MQNVITQPRQGTDRRILFAAACLGLLAALFAIIYLNSAKTKTEVQVAPAAPVSVVVAARDIPAGQRITVDALTLKQVAQLDVVPGSFRNTEQVVGQTVRYP